MGCLELPVKFEEFVSVADYSEACQTYEKMAFLVFFENLCAIAMRLETQLQEPPQVKVEGKERQICWLPKRCGHGTLEETGTKAELSHAAEH